VHAGKRADRRGPQRSDLRLTVSVHDIADTIVDLLVLVVIVAAVIWASKR
jgi:hypothetical protein